MSVEAQVVATLKALPAEMQQEVLHFARLLASREQEPVPRPPLKGLCADLHVRVTAQDIEEARREMWGPYMGEGSE